MSSLQEFYMAELTLQAEFKRRGLSLPDIEDDLPSKSEIFVSDLLGSGQKVQETYLASRIKGESMTINYTNLEEFSVDDLQELSKRVNLSLNKKAEEHKVLHEHIDLSSTKPKEEDTEDLEDFKALSFEQLATMVSRALSNVKDSSGYPGSFWPVSTYKDYVVASEWSSGSFFKFPYSVKKGEVEFGEAVRVEQEFVEIPSGQKTGIRLLKDEKTGQTRWAAISSNTLRDSDNERFEAKALDEAVEFMEESQDFGELRLEHHIASAVGQCDKSQRVGSFLIEQGYFYDTPRAKAAIKTLEEDSEAKFRISIGYFYNEKFLTDDGVYTGKVRIFERSITATPANKFTAISLADLSLEGGKMDSKQMRDRLSAIVGEEEADKILKERKEALIEVLGVKAEDLGLGVKSEEEQKTPKQELPVEIVIIGPDGEEMKAVREDTLSSKEQDQYDPSDLASIIKKAMKESLAPIEARLLAVESGLKSRPDENAPRSVRYRVLKAEDPEDEEGEEEEGEEEEKTAIRADRANADGKAFSWGSFAGGKK